MVVAMKGDLRAFLGFVRVALVSGLVLTASVAQATPAAAGDVLVDFVYPQHSEESSVVRAARLLDGRVLPYATLALTFTEALSASDMDQIESELRVIREGSDGGPLAHLHEAVAGMVVRGPHASFQWRQVDEQAVLWYRPFGLDADASYRLELPAGWQTAGGPTAFETAAMTGTLRTYELIIPELEDWREVTTVSFTQSIRKVPCVVFDRFNRDTTRPLRYGGAEVKIRGRNSRGNAQKNLTVSFDKSARFEGFDDENGFQGARRKIALTAESNTNVMFSNKVSFDIARHVETRQLGASWTPDANYTQWVINGQYWGAYLMTEHVSPGGGGYTDMADRAEILGARKHAIIHKVDTGGQRIRGVNVIPKTDHELALAQGDGVWTDFNLSPSYPIFSQIRGDHWSLYNLDLKVTAKTASGRKMTLVADLSSAVLNPFGGQVRTVALMVEDTGEYAGEVDNLDSASPSILAEFPEPVGDGKKVKVELNTAYDYQVFAQAIEEDPSAMYQWHDLDGVLTYWFITRLLGGTRENQSRNTYMVMNWDDLATFLDPTSASPRPRELYRPILWDCDFCFMSGALRPREGDEERFSAAKALPEARQAYADMFLPELAPGGVLSERFYLDRFAAYAETTGNVYALHGIRWFDDADFGPDYDRLLETHVWPKLADHAWLHEYLLRLDLDTPTEARFLRGDANHDGKVDMSDAIAILHMLFRGSLEPTTCLIADACDVNDDGHIDVADPMRLFGWLFQGGPGPEAPYPSRGHDPTFDLLDAP